MAYSNSVTRAAFVTGGSGFVGSKLIKALVSQGWRVRALARSDAAEAAVAALGAEAVAGDVNGARELGAGMAGCEIIFHVAAHFKLWGPQKVFDEVNVEGTRAVVDAAAATPGVRRVVMVSAAAVVMGAPEPMRNVSEGAPLRFMSFAPYSTSKARAEQILLAANGKRAGFETIAIRPPFIWGDGMPTLDHMVENVEKGRFQWVGGGRQAMSTCHVDNLVDALILAADKGRGGEAYFVSDATGGTLKSVLSELLATRGVTAADKAAPFGVAWAMAGVMGGAWRLFGLKGEPSITRQMLRLIGKDFTIDTAKIKRDFGYRPRVDRQAGLAEMTRSRSEAPNAGKHAHI